MKNGIPIDDSTLESFYQLSDKYNIPLVINTIEKT
jgi:hypothetical protein